MKRNKILNRKIMGDSSELLLCLDSNFKLKPAKKEKNFKNKSHSPIFLQKYRAPL